MARIGNAKSGGFVGNLAKLGGRGSKLHLKSDMQKPHFSGKTATFKKAHKQAHKKV